jgi:hypothetical protein
MSTSCACARISQELNGDAHIEHEGKRELLRLILSRKYAPIRLIMDKLLGCR